MSPADLAREADDLIARTRFVFQLDNGGNSHVDTVPYLRRAIRLIEALQGRAPSLGEVR